MCSVYTAAITPRVCTSVLFIIAAIIIVLWIRRKQGQKRSHDPPNCSGSQHKLSKLVHVQSDTAMNINLTSHAEVSPNEMNSNIAYGSVASGQQMSTDILPSEIQNSDMQSNIAYAPIAFD